MFSFFKKKKNDEEDAIVEKPVENFENVEIIAGYFKNETGVHFEKQKSVLKNKLTIFCRQRKVYSLEELKDKILRDIDLKQELIDVLTTNETYFNREFKQIEDLVKLVKEKNTNVEILCAPCSTGEEPYSIAIALLEAGVSSSSFTITGIDINNEALQKAKTAKYKQRNVKNLSDDILNKYFDKENSIYILRDSVKSLVKLELVNIFDDNFKRIGKFDYIFSRNMLIYFDYDTKIKAKQILESLRKDNSQEIFFGHADIY